MMSQNLEIRSRARDRLRSAQSQEKDGGDGRAASKDHPTPPRDAASENAAPASPEHRPRIPRHSEEVRVGQWEAVKAFQGAENGDLSFAKGQLFAVLEAERADGWWTCRMEEGGAEGLVPSNYLRRHEPYAEAGEAEAQPRRPPRTARLKRPGSLRGHQLWGGLRKSVKQVTEDDVLKALGALPSGVSPAFIGTRMLSDPHLSLACHLTPRLSESNLAFHDLYWNAERDKVLKRNARVLKVLKLDKLDGLPSLEGLSGHEVLSRHVRLALYDGAEIASNVHTVKAVYSARSPHLWRFKRDADSFLDSAEFFVRSNYAKSSVRLLVEPSVGLLNKSSGQRGEVSLGHCLVPLLKTDAEQGETHFAPEQVPNKDYQLPLRPGGPSKGPPPPVELRPSVTRGQPTLSIAISRPGDELKLQLDGLPDVLVWDTGMAEMAYLYRRRAGELLVRDADEEVRHWSEPRWEPFVATFPYVAQEPDLMRLVAGAWELRRKALSRAERKEEAVLMTAFRSVFLETGVALYNTLALPDFDLLDRAGLEERARAFAKFHKMYYGGSTGGAGPHSGAAFLRGNGEAAGLPFAPINIFDYAVDIVGPHCLN